MSSIGVTPAKRTVRSRDLDHGACFSAGRLRAHARDDEPPEARQVLRELVDEPARRGQQHLQQADAEEDQQRGSGCSPHCAWKRNGTQLLEDAGDDRAPEAEDAADQRRRGQGERVLRLEGDRRGTRPTCAASRQPATPVTNDASANAQSL